MGLFDMIPGVSGSPFAQWVGDNRGTFQTVGNSLLGQGNDFRGMAAQLGQNLSSYQQVQKADKEKADAVKAEQDKQNQTIAMLQKANRQDLVQYVTATGDVQGAFKQYLTDMHPAAKDPIKLSQGDTLLDPDTHQPIFTAPQQPNLPSGMVQGPNGTQIAPEGSKEAFDREQAIAAQYTGADPVKTYQVVRNGYEKVRSASQLNTGAGDVSMIFAYMKMLDPTSVVREGEFATAQNTAGLPATVVNLYNQAMSGIRLNPDQRKQFLAAADAIYGDAAKNITDSNTLYSGRAKPWGVDPSHFIINPEQYPTLAPPGGADPLGIR